MEIILKEDIIGLGFKNDIVNVKSGYGRNYLIPSGKAVIASPSAKKILAENLKQQAHKLAAILAAAEKEAEQLNGVSNNLSTTYQQLAEAMKANTTSISNGSNSYSEQLGQLNKHMTALNALHEQHLNATSQRLTEVQNVYAGVDNMTQKLKETIDGTDKFAKALEMLNNNVASLNSVYGNMLSAMTSLSSK